MKLNEERLAKVLQRIPQIGDISGVSYEDLARVIVIELSELVVTEILEAVVAEVENEEKKSPIPLKETKLTFVCHPSVFYVLMRSQRFLEHYSHQSAVDIPRILGVPILPCVRSSEIEVDHWRIENDLLVVKKQGSI